MRKLTGFTVVLLSVILVLALILGGCSSATPSTNAPAPTTNAAPQPAQTTNAAPPPAQTTSAPPSSSAAPAPPSSTAAPASSAAPSGTIKIGLVSAYSGMMAAVAPYWLNGVQMAIDEANAAGGAMGTKFELVARDDQTDPSVAVQKANELKAAGVVAIVGSLMESSDEAEFSWAKDNHIPVMISQSPGQKQRTVDFHKYAFFPVPVSSAWAGAAVQAVNSMNVKSVYFMGGDQTIAHELHDFFWAKMKTVNPNISDLGFSLLPFSQTDFANTISTILAKKPDVLITILGGPTWAAFVQQGKQFDVFNKTQVLAWGGLGPDNTAPFGKNFPTTIKAIDDSAFYLNDPAMQTYTKNYFASAKLYPADITLPFYLGTKAFTTAIKQANSTNADDIVKALETVKIDAPVGPVTFDSWDHQAEMPIWVAQAGFTNDFPIAVGLNPTKYLDGLYPTKAEVEAARAGK